MVCTRVKEHLTIGPWDWQSDQLELVTAQITPDKSTSPVVLSPDGKKLASAGTGRIHVWDLAPLPCQSLSQLSCDA